jgi:hypothetical protein
VKLAVCAHALPPTSSAAMAAQGTFCDGRSPALYA